MNMDRLACFMVSAVLMGPAFAAQQQVTEPLMLDIPALPLNDALKQLARQAGFQVVFYSSESEGFRAPKLSGRFTPQAALSELLAGTALRYEFVNANTVAIRSAKPAAERASVDTGSGDHGVKLAQSGDDSASVIGDDQQANRSPEISGEFSERKVEEIVVTAQKRAERLQDVPVPVTAIRAEALVDSNQLRLQDYYTKVPGLNLTMLGDVGAPSISIRGLTTGGYVSPTVAIVVDDVPFGASTAATNINQPLAPDIDPSELTRVEVLRGPQGTLYGASTLGGLLKYVTVDPSTDRVSGRVQLGTTAVSGSDEFGYSVRGSVNVPIGDTFAVRASGSTRREPGYIDNLQTGQDDLNRTESESGRLAALWRPNNNFSVKLSALYQHTERDGAFEVHLPPPVGVLPGLGDLEQNVLLNTGLLDQTFQAYSATMTATLGVAELTSLTGYNISKTSSALDVTPSIGNQTLARFGVRGVIQENVGETSKFSQELRLSMPLTDKVEWLFGAFYTRENYPAYEDILAVSPATAAFVASWRHGDSAGRYTEYAAFTDLTFQVTERFDLQIGGRKSHNTVDYATSSFGPFNTQFNGLPSEVSPLVEFESEDDPFTYLVTPRFKISQDLMVYARLASGYRPGGPNTSVAARTAGLPTEYGHDTTRNYEIGVKGDLLARTLSFDASLYYIDWQDVQLQLRDPVNSTLTYTLNAGAAKSKGIELSVVSRPLEGLSISAWAAYNDAELTEVPVISNLTARAGDKLPYSARRSGNLAIDQEFPLLNSGATGFVGASVSYVGERMGRFFRNVSQGSFPAYTQVDLRGGARFGSWTVNAFVNNVADKRGVLRSGRDASNSLLYVVSYNQPRTVGLNLAKEF